MADVTPRPELFRGYLRILAQTLLRAAGPLQNKIGASDLVQETLMQAHVAADQFRGTTEEQLAAWLRQILANKLADAARHFGCQKRDAGLEQRYRETLDQSASRLERLLVANDQISAGEKAIRYERVLRIAAALHALPEDQRMAVELHHLVGCTVTEVAAEMDRTNAAVAGLLRRGLKKLRETLESGGSLLWPEGRSSE